MTERKFKIRFPEILYQLYILLIILNYMVENSSIMENYNESFIHNILVYFSLALALVYIFLRKYSRKELIEIIILNSVGVICYFSSGKSRLLIITLAISLLPRGSLNKILKLIFKEELFVFICIILAALHGFLPNIIMEMDKISVQTTAMTLGFGHPNRLAAQATSLIFLYLSIKRKHIKKIDIGISAILTTLIFVITKSRTPLILTIIVLCLISARKKKFVRNGLFKILPCVYTMIMAMMAIFIISRALFGQENMFVHLIDILYNGRVDLAYRSILTYPITMFGKEIDISRWTYFYYANDNGQVKVLLEYGLVGFLSYYWIFQNVLKGIKKSEDYIFAVVIIAFIIWTTIEGNMYSIEWNFSLLFYGLSDLYKNRKRIKKGKESDNERQHKNFNYSSCI